MRKNHCSRFRASTSAPQRSQRPSITCSFASTVWSFGAPVDGRLLAVGQVALEELQEQPLRPAVVLGSCAETSRSQSIAQPSAAHLLPDPRDVALGDLARMAALLDRRVLGGQAERVEAHRPQDRVAVAAAEVRDDVPERVVQDVPHVQVAGGVRQHLEHVVLLRARSASAGLGIRARRTRARPPRRAATSPRSPVGRIARPSPPPDTKKPLVREAVESWRGARRVRSLRYSRSCPFIANLTVASCTFAVTPARGGERMADYTVLKVSDVADQGPNFGLEGKMEARFMRVDLGCENCGVTYLRLAPGFRIPFGHTAQGAGGGVRARVRAARGSRSTTTCTTSSRGRRSACRRT